MDSIYEDVRSILENRRIRSEILLQQQNEQIRISHPEVAEIEQKIADVSEEILINSLEGRSSEDLQKELVRLKMEREKVLFDCGLSTDKIKIRPYCEKCKDTGYIEEEGKAPVLCDCIRTLLAPVMTSRSGVEKYPEYSFENDSEHFFAENSEPQKNYKKLRRLTEKEKVPNAVFFGRSGRGKTFTAVAIARQYAKQGRSSFVIRMAEAQELMMEHRKLIQSFYTPAAKEHDVERKVAYLMEADLLVLDDLGVEPKTANTEADLLNILDTRILSGRTTILTTNFDMDTLKTHYAGRVFDRIDRSFARFNFSSEGSRA